MRKRWIFIVWIAIWAITQVPALAAPDEAVVPGAVRVYATFNHLGVLWEISGDTDLDSHLTLEYRLQGQSAWNPGAPAVRAYPALIVDGDPLGLNYWAASAMFLESGQTYELRLTLIDPDGGGSQQIISGTTRVEMQPNPLGRQLYIIPGSSGGDGNPGNPFRGLQTAANAAQAGDVFHIASGTYSPFQLLQSGTASLPVVFQGPGDGTAIIDGGGTDRGVVTLGDNSQPIGFVILEGLVIQNRAWGVDAQRSHDITLRRNTIRDVDEGVVNRRDFADEYNQTLCDNVIEGRTPWPQTGGQIPSEQGIELKGTGNVVCHNRVRYFGDCISVQPSTGPSYGNDVFGNDVSFCVDDGIQIDYNQANVRVWRNRAYGSRMGVSVQPIRGGPAYIFRNEFFNLESNPIKMHNDTTGFWVAHNTAAKHDNGQGDDNAMWRNVVYRNNLILGTRYAFEFVTTADEGFRDFDYNAWGTTRAIGDPSDPYFKWDNVRYDRLSDLQATGVESHGVEALFSHLVNAALPAAWDVAVPPGSRDLRLVAGAPEIDAGVSLPNLDDPFVSDGQPDLGAFEFGEPSPHYGPRPVILDNSLFLPLLEANGGSTRNGHGKALHSPLAQTGDPPPVYLPLVAARGASLQAARRANAPHFSGDIPFPQTAIFWFGRVNPDENYADVRLAYNDETLYVYLAAFDRRLWYDGTPSAADLAEWDSVTLYLNTGGNTGSAPGLTSYSFTAQLNNGLEDDSRYELTARGNGSAWANSAVDFYSRPGWRGTILNDNGDDRGWTMTFRIPFASLNIGSPPPAGALWGMALALHDRDSAAGPPQADKTWPEAANLSQPSTWGQLHFGMPSYTPPPVPPSGGATIRHRLNGTTVRDAAVGGYSLCGEGTDFWTEWGDTPETFYTPEHADFNIQNQSDVADWPCFSKYYVTFPLDAIPPGKRILSASLTLHLFGNAGSAGQAQHSLIQVFTVSQDWSDANLTWNNAPYAWENVSTAWVDPVAVFPGWPGVPTTWDMSYALAWAYSRGEPLRLAVYSADGAYHSGKYFVSSDTGDWNAAGRPALEVVWGEGN